MSILETPRINFKGHISWDPIVTNNSKNLYDEAGAQNVTTAWTKTVEDYRANAIVNGGWNADGTHRSVFYNTYVNSTVGKDGFIEEDPFLDSPVDFKGMLVDSEPYGGFSSQLFFDGLNLGILGGCRISAKRSNRMTARYINFNRLPSSVYGYAASVASVGWQTTFLKNDVIIDAFDSPSLQALKVAMDDPDVLGLVYRFNAYSTKYYGAETDDNLKALTAELIKKQQGGGFQPNPARSSIVGSVGIWRKNEPIHEPGDRAILQPSDFTVQQNNPLADAHIRVNTDSLSIDFSNTVQNEDLENNPKNLDNLNITATAPDGSKTVIATLDYGDYDKAAYEKGAGIIEKPITAEHALAANAGTINIESSDGSKTYLHEIPLRAIPDVPNKYLNANQTGQVKVQVYNKGIPVGAGVTVTAELEYIYKTGTKGATVSATTDSTGIVAFNVGSSTGCVQGFLLKVDPFDMAWNQVRVLPENYLTAEQQVPTWNNVYEHILKSWKAMAPCMDNWLDLADENQVLTYADKIKSLTDPNNFEMFLFMPVTRDMPDWQRLMLYNFLDSPNITTKLAAKARVKSDSEITTKSQSFRSPKG